MPEPASDTREAPPEGQEPQEPQDQEPQEEEAQEEQEEQEEPDMADQITQKVMHGLQSWVGRRDQAIMQQVEQRLAAVQQQRGREEAPDPRQDADKWYEFKRQQEEQKQMAYNQTVGSVTVGLIQNDPVASADPTIAEEIARDILQGQVPIDRTLPPDKAGFLAFSAAKNNALARRLGQRVNPLSKNQPGGARGAGGVAPPATKKKKPAPPKGSVSDFTQQMAKRWYGDKADEKLSELFVEE